MTINLDELRAKKEGRVTPKTLIEHLLIMIERGDIESVAFVAKTKDQMLDTGWSDITSVEALGMLSVGQSQIIRMMGEED